MVPPSDDGHCGADFEMTWMIYGCRTEVILATKVSDVAP